MGKVGGIYKSALKRQHGSKRPDAPSRPPRLPSLPYVTYSTVKLPWQAWARQRVGRLDVFPLHLSLRSFRGAWTEKRARAASHKLRGRETGREAVSRLTAWSWVCFSSLPPLLPVPLRADPRLGGLAHCHPQSILRSPCILACIHHH